MFHGHKDPGDQYGKGHDEPDAVGAKLVLISDTRAKGRSNDEQFNKEATKEAVLSEEWRGFDSFAAALQVVQLSEQFAQVAVFVFVQYLVAFELGEHLKLVAQCTVGYVALCV